MCDPCKIEISPMPSTDTVVGGVNRTGPTHIHYNSVCTRLMTASFDSRQ